MLGVGSLAVIVLGAFGGEFEGTVQERGLGGKLGQEQQQHNAGAALWGHGVQTPTKTGAQEVGAAAVCCLRPEGSVAGQQATTIL